MLVYRYLEKRELEHIKNNELDKIGGHFTERMSNNFNYNKNTKYLHFFKDFSSMNFIRKIDFKLSGEFYFCTFDIPISLLIAGVGEYHNENFKGIIKLEEFIMDANKLKPEWLIDATPDLTREKDKKQNEENFNNFFDDLAERGTLLNSDSDYFDL